MGRGLRGRKMHFFVKNTKQNRPRHISQFWGSGGLGLRLPSPRLGGGGYAGPVSSAWESLLVLSLTGRNFPCWKPKGWSPKCLAPCIVGKPWAEPQQRLGEAAKESLVAERIVFLVSSPPWRVEVALQSSAKLHRPTGLCVW